MSESSQKDEVLSAIAASLTGIPEFRAEDFIQAHHQPAVTSVRLHPLKKSVAFENAAKVPWCAEGRYLDQRPVFTLDPLYHAGGYYVQEASSMFLDHVLRQVLPEKKNRRILDLCAAPGGKSTLIASLLNKDDLLISNEVIRSRAGILEENITRWGYSNSWVSSNDPVAFGRLGGYFDVMVIDAPCSGSGLIRKDAAAANEYSESAVMQCAARQKRIIADAWPALKEDGILIYATCSYSKEEDEEILQWLGSELEAEGIQISYSKDWNIVETISGDQLYGYRFFPQLVNGEGFFIAALRKTSGADSFYYPSFRNPKDKKAALAVKDLLKGDWQTVEDNRKQAIAIHPYHEPDFNLLQEVLYLRKAGVHLGEAGRKDWQPAHDVALSVDRNPALPVVDVDRHSALLFLKKEPFPHPESLPKGWYLVSYGGLCLGWIKNLSERFNNYLPRHWRIRMELEE